MRYEPEPADSRTPEQLFDRVRAITILQQTMEDLADDYAKAGKTGLFDGLREQLVAPIPTPARWPGL